MKTKIVKKFQCEVCHTEYIDEEEAMNCEKNHKIPQTIVDAKHLPEFDNNTGYPITVTVLMSDGEKVTYIAERSVQKW